MTHSSTSDGLENTPEGSSADQIGLKPLGQPEPEQNTPVQGPTIPRRVQVIHDAAPSGTGPSAFRLVVGFVLVLAAALTTFIPLDLIQDRLTDVLWHDVHPEKWWAFWVEGGVLLVLSVVLLLPGGLCLRSGSFLHYLITSMLIGISGFCANMLIESKIEWSWMVLMAVCLGYLIHASGRIAKLSVRGLFSWAVIVLCAVGCSQGWFDWSALGSRLGDGAARFLENWGADLFTWLTVLVLTAIGVSCSKTKPIHFLNAGLLAALAYYCFQDGFVQMVSFPELGENIPPLPKESIDNIDPWRWVVLGELVLLAIVLLHMSMGVGSLTVAFAAAWLALVLHVDKEYGADAMFAVIQANSLANQKPGAGTRSPLSFFPRTANEGKSQDRLSPEQVKANLVKAQTRVGVIFIWVYLTAILAGLIAVSGLRMLILHKRARIWACFGLWFALGLGVAWLWTIWPEANDFQSRLSAFVLPAAHRYAIGLVGLGFAALLGSWALWEDSRYDHWLYVAISSILIGTALTLIAVAVIIRFGGFEVMPVWVYVAIAAGQSSMMWILLMHHTLRGRSAPAPQQASAA